jgi:hypothetical protein
MCCEHQSCRAAGGFAVDKAWPHPKLVPVNPRLSSTESEGISGEASAGCHLPSMVSKMQFMNCNSRSSAASNIRRFDLCQPGSVGQIVTRKVTDMSRNLPGGALRQEEVIRAIRPKRVKSVPKPENEKELL